MSLPAELLDVITSKTGFSILVKGPAGVGKTLLTLEMLLAAPRGLYVSSRVSPGSLFDHVPGFTEKMAKIRVVDASKAMVPQVTSTSDQKQALFNTIRYQDLPEFMQNLIIEIEDATSGCNEPVLVAIDSWEAVLEVKRTSAFSPESGQKRVESLLADIIKLSNVNLILVAEHDGSSFLDYIVDAVFCLSSTYVNGHPVRSLEIQKLRGARISHPRYTYSLEGGRFSHFEAFSFSLPEIMVRRSPIKDPRPLLMSTGSETFDALFHDGIKHGSWVLFEVGEGIGDGFYQFIIPLVSNHLNLDRKLSVILPEGTSIYQFEKLHSGFVPRDKFTNHVLVYEMMPAGFSFKGEVSSTVNFIDPDPDTMFGQMHDRISQDGKDPANPPLLLVALDTLELFYDEKAFLKALVSNIAFTKNSLNVTVALAKSEQRCVETLSHLCSQHWKIELLHQSLFIRGIQPVTGYFGVRTSLKQGYIDLEFVPVV